MPSNVKTKCTEILKRMDGRLNTNDVFVPSFFSKLPLIFYVSSFLYYNRLYEQQQFLNLIFKIRPTIFSLVVMTII
jgi:hypothetical protein